MGAKTLQQWFPGTALPFIANAPMFTATNAKLATAVTRAKGLGFIGAGFDFSPNSGQLTALDAQLTSARSLLELAPDAPLPVGVGFLTMLTTAEAFNESTSTLLQKHKPSAVWLFCPDPKDRVHPGIISNLHSIGESWGLKAAVQVGTVAAAREALEDGADIIVAQGTDAGGHQWANGSGITTLVPEVTDMIRQEFSGREVAVIASGGIVDDRGVAAALVLGADGVCMGTRFLVSDECPIAQEQKDAILAATDGGASTAKSTIHDDIGGTNIFPDLYDGRALVGTSYKDYLKGVPVADLVKLRTTAIAAGDLSRSIQFVGAALGLVKERGNAADIVERIRSETIRRIQGMSAGQ